MPIMNVEHEALLKTALGLDGDDSEVVLPDNVTDLYWKFERTYRKLHVNVSLETLALICILVGRPAQEKPISFLDSDVERGDSVLAKHKGYWAWSTYVATRNGKIRVCLSNGEEHEFGVLDVRVPTKEEQVAVGS